MINTENIVDLAELDTELVYLAMAFSTIESNQQVVDFSAVERALGEKFMRYKPEIHLAVKIPQLGDIEYSIKVLDDTRANLEQTEPLSAKELSDVKSCRDLPMVCRAMSQIILAMKYSSSGRKDNESGPVNESDTTIGEILTTVHVEFVNSIRDLKFKRIVSVWQAFALQKTALLIEHKEDPYLNLPSDFKKKLEPDIQESCIKRLGLDDKCNRFMLALNEILLHLNYEPYRNIRSDWRVKDCIEVVEPEDDISCDLPDEITMEFSESLMMTLIANGNSGNIRNSNKNIV
ncbi:uncharacterized protein LOC134846896 [Symsagittifera roscoffensis]|uniref:uncharacterized protein LOC134846896 n=1 Tax=Symsagittifera roscoffensis TaxID=84072 RepID=UPI00307C6866